MVLSLVVSLHINAYVSSLNSTFIHRIYEVICGIRLFKSISLMTNVSEYIPKGFELQNRLTKLFNWRRGITRKYIKNKFSKTKNRLQNDTICKIFCINKKSQWLYCVVFDLSDQSYLSTYKILRISKEPKVLTFLMRNTMLNIEFLREKHKYL